MSNRNPLEDLRSSLRRVPDKSGEIQLAKTQNANKSTDSGYKTLNSSNEGIPESPKSTKNSESFDELRQRLNSESPDENDLEILCAHVDDIEAQRLIILYCMLPTNQTGFQGSRSKAVLKRIISMLSSHPKIFSFHLIHLEVHRDREDRENFKQALLNLHEHFKGDFVTKLAQKLDSHFFLKKPIINFSPTSEELTKWNAEFSTLKNERRSIARPSILSRKSRNFSRPEPVERSPEEIENARKPKRAESETSLNPPKITRFGSDSQLPKPEESNRKTHEQRPKSGQVRFQEQVKPGTSEATEREKFKTPATLRKQESAEKRTSTQSVFVNGTEYTVLDKLGQGGFSKVYHCTDPKRQSCALKYVDLGKVDKGSREGIENEIKHLERLRGSQNIVKLLNYEVTEKRLFIVLEYGETDLQHYLSANSGLIPSTIISFWFQMVTAVSVVHGAGIIHRDLKPCNFLIVKGVIKLIDFGIANNISNDVTSLATDMVGTLNYMAPEQLLETEEGSRSAKVGKWADTWSLGCILYLMAYGKLPYQEFKSTHMKIAKITSESHQIEFSKHPCFGLVPMLKKCLKFRPKERPLPEEILKSSFFRAPSLDHVLEGLKFLSEDEFLRVYKEVQKLAA